MNESFIHKYKPTNLETIYLNEKVKDIIETIIEKRNINLLFLGNNETGKTTLINILNNTIKRSILINNLKENGINTFRTDIKLYCQLTQKNKTILIDDYDRITDSCQYVIKTLMDNYKNILFISTIKDIKKLIEPLKHKFFIIKLDNITNEFLKTLMDNVLEKENIELKEETKKYIINISDFSINRMYNYLEKIKLLDIKLNHNNCLKILTNINYNTFDNILKLCQEKNKLKVYNDFNTIYMKGYSITDIFDFFYKFIKKINYIDESIRFKIIKLLCEYISISDSINELDTELILFSYELVEIF
tara:strand:+ start:715 stop:1626 length:912 start_codon:yes stop_codon:yes gene_type:complete